MDSHIVISSCQVADDILNWMSFSPAHYDFICHRDFDVQLCLLIKSARVTAERVNFKSHCTAGGCDSPKVYTQKNKRCEGRRNQSINRHVKVSEEGHYCGRLN